MEDRQTFVDTAKLLNIELTAEIKLSLWINIMNKANLKFQYLLYRRAYWGETNGRTFVSKTFTLLNCRIGQYGSENGLQIKLLVEENRITILNGNIILSRYVNKTFNSEILDIWNI